MTTYIENVDEIKSKLNAEAVLKLVQPGIVRLSGGELRCACPIHGGSGENNFSLNVSTHQFHCHSKRCKGTNLIDLYVQCTKVSFHDAIKALATEFGIGIIYRDPKADNLRSPTTIKNPQPRPPLNRSEAKQSKGYARHAMLG